MAKVKPATSRKMVKPKQQVVETAADEITTALDRLSDHLSKHLNKYVGGLAGVCVVAFGLNTMVEMKATEAVERSNAASAALSATTESAATWGDSETLSGLPGLTPPSEDKPAVKADHADAAAKNAAVDKAVSDASAKVSEETAAVVSLVQSSSAFTQGNFDDSVEALQAAMGTLGTENSMQPLLLEQKGKLAEAKGDKAAAEEAYTALSQLGSLYFQVRGLTLLGELKADTDSAAAKTAYASALEKLVPGEGKVLPQSLRTLRSELARRHAQL